MSAVPPQEALDLLDAMADTQARWRTPGMGWSRGRTILSAIAAAAYMALCTAITAWAGASDAGVAAYAGVMAGGGLAVACCLAWVARRNRPYLYSAWAADILVHIATRHEEPSGTLARHEARMVRALHDQQELGRLTTRYARDVVSCMAVSRPDTAMLLHAHLVLLVEAEAIRRPHLRALRDRLRRS